MFDLDKEIKSISRFQKLELKKRKKKYKVTNKKGDEVYFFTPSKDEGTPRHWIINHLDISQEWIIEKVR